VDGQVDFDESGWPIVIVGIPRALDAPAVESLLAGFDKVLTRQAKFAAVVDTTLLTQMPTALERGHIGEYMKARTMAEATFNMGNAVVLTNPLPRVVLMAINWIRRPLTPQHFASTRVEAVEWCRDRLVKSGVDITGELEAMLIRERVRGAASTKTGAGQRTHP
jgi:hypothetical protein